MSDDRGSGSALGATYVLPISVTERLCHDGLAYLRSLATIVDEVLVIDGSPPSVFDAHRSALGDVATVTRPDAAFQCRNGKVAGVLTGVALASHDAIVIADDDVRYDAEGLQRVIDRLAGASAVMPQNVYDPLPWHARWDTGRILVHRAFGGDMGGTVAIRRDALARAGGYDGDVLFENLELLRTVRARGGRVVHAADVFVRREPPTVRHFAQQRVRQAYDEFARPWLLALWLAIAPAVGWSLATRGRRAWRALGLTALGTIMLAEAGRRRAGGAHVFSPTAPLWAPLWFGERAVCAWLAVAARSRGGARYRGARFPQAATPPWALRRSVTAQVGR